MSYLDEGRALEAAGKLEQALDQYFMAMLDPQATPELELRMIATLGRVGRGDDAKALAEKLRARGIDLAAAWFELGVAYKARGELADAIFAVAHCVQLEPNQGDGWYNLACYRCVAGDLRGAIEALGFAVRIAPENAKAAVEDSDFAAIRGDERFIAITA